LERAQAQDFVDDLTDHAAAFLGGQGNLFVVDEGANGIADQASNVFLIEAVIRDTAAQPEHQVVCGTFLDACQCVRPGSLGRRCQGFKPPGSFRCAGRNGLPGWFWFDGGCFFRGQAGALEPIDETHGQSPLQWSWWVGGAD
jgi:hypothetical protein